MDHSFNNYLRKLNSAVEAMNKLSDNAHPIVSGFIHDAVCTASMEVHHHCCAVDERRMVEEDAEKYALESEGEEISHDTLGHKKKPGAVPYDEFLNGKRNG